MNRTFKRVISSVLAFVMVMSCMIMTNVAVSFAAESTKTYEFYYNPDESNAVVNTESFFTQSATFSTSSNASASATTEAGVKTLTHEIKMDSNTNLSFKIPDSATAASVSVLFASNSTTGDAARLKLVGTEGSEEKTYKSEDITTKYTETKTFTQSGLYAGTTYVLSADNKQPLVFYVKVEVTADDSAASLSLNPNTLTISAGKTGTINAILNNSSESVAWKSDKADQGITVDATDGNDKIATVTVSADVAGGTTATITATAGELEATATVTVQPEVKGTEGTVDNLVAATKTTTYDFLKTAEDAGFGDSFSAQAAYIANNLYFNKEIFVGGNGLLYYAAKTSSNLDNSTNKNGIRLKAKQDVFAVKLAAGSSITVPVYGGGSGERMGIIATDINANSTDGALASTTDIGSAAGSSPQNLEYTNETGADQVVYVTATSDSFFSQVKVTVPESLAENEIKGVAYGDNYVVFGISAANAAKYNSYEIVGGTAEGGNTVYTGVEFAEGTKTVSEIPGIDTEYCVAYKFDNVDGNLDALVKAVKLSLK